MNRPALTFLAALLAGAATPLSSAAANFPPAPAIGPLKPFELPKMDSYQLANGMRVTLIPYGQVPQTTISLRSFVGDLDAGGTPWLAAITADLLKEGAGGRDGPELAEADSAMGGNLATAADANSTTVGTTVLSDRAAEAIALVADIARRPTFAADDFARIKTNRGRALAQAMADPTTIADALLLKQIFRDHPYGSPLPTSAQLEAIDLAKVRAFHAANFGARRSHLYIVGRFDPVAVRAAVEQAFGNWAAGPERKRLEATVAAGPRVLLADRPGAEQTTLRLSFPAPAVGSADEMRMGAMDALLGGSFNSRITRNIREDKGYTYSPYSSILAQPQQSAWIWRADVTPAVTGASLSEVFKEVKALQAAAPGNEEAEGMKTYRATYVMFRSTSAELLINQLRRAETLGLPADYFTHFVTRAMAVKPEEMKAIAAKTLPLDRMTLLVVGDAKTVEPQLRALPELNGFTIERVALPGAAR